MKKLQPTPECTANFELILLTYETSELNQCHDRLRQTDVGKFQVVTP